MIKKWNILADLIEDDFTFSPQIPDRETAQLNLSSEKKIITLVPYGATSLRITIFPQARYDGYTKIIE